MLESEHQAVYRERIKEIEKIIRFEAADGQVRPLKTSATFIVNPVVSQRHCLRVRYRPPSLIICIYCRTIQTLFKQV